MTRRDELLRAVLADPDEDGPRLVYADYLMGEGDPQGEFIATQIELTGKINPARRRRAKERELDILIEHEDEFKLPARSFGGRPILRRGFIDEVSCSAKKFVTGAAALMATNPVRSLTLFSTSVDHLGELERLGILGRIRCLRLRGKFGEAGAKILAASEQLASVQRLNLSACGLGDHGVRALAESAHCRPFSLTLNANEITDTGVRAIIASAGLAHCQYLYLARNEITDDGARVLAESGRGFRKLSLTGNEEITDSGASAFAREDVAAAIGHLELELIGDISGSTEDRLDELYGSRVSY